MLNDKRGAVVRCRLCGWQGYHAAADSNHLPECDGECLPLDVLFPRISAPLLEVLGAIDRRWTLEDMRRVPPLGIHLWAMREKPSQRYASRIVDELKPVLLDADQVGTFVNLVKRLPDVESIEAGLYPSSHDGEASVSFATKVSLDLFLRAFGDAACELQEDTSALRSHVYWQTLGWRSAGAEIVDVRFNCDLASTRAGEGRKAP